MSRYDRGYDYGLRGGPARRPAHTYGHEYGGRGAAQPDRRLGYRESNRVTARYNLDYVYGARGDASYRNYNMYTGDRPGRVGDPRMYQRPYMTTGGTRTYRGANPPSGYDAPDYGPDFGGRYPDEL